VSTGAAAGTNSDRLAALGLVLPPVPAPAASYVPAVRHGDLVLVSGQLPMRDGALLATGLVGMSEGQHSVEQAAELARVCALNVLAAAASVAGGLDAIAGVLRAGIFVASGDGFTSQHLVGNGASELFAAVLGPGAVHARMAVGVARLPLDAPVEVEAVVAVRA
jgi:enamine deaminase RidA (YjgF/YER057c/UK114 family)